MNTENQGITFARIKTNKKNSKILSCEDNEKKVHNYFEEYKALQGESLQLIPFQDSEKKKNRTRNVLYIVGSSGSGKSFFSKQYIMEYHKLFPTRPVYVFSVFTEDESLDDLKYLNRIKLGEDLLKSNLELSDFNKSLCLFDDIDTLKQKELKTKVMGILHTILECGRHEEIDVIYISHVCCKGSETQAILNESSTITFFPKTLAPRSCKYLLEQYYGLDKNQIKKIKSLKSSSRAITILKSYPNIVLSQKYAYILKEDD